jgi:hypothetical protein
VSKNKRARIREHIVSIYVIEMIMRIDDETYGQWADSSDGCQQVTRGIRVLEGVDYSNPVIADDKSGVPAGAPRISRNGGPNTGCYGFEAEVLTLSEHPVSPKRHQGEQCKKSHDSDGDLSGHRFAPNDKR